MWLPTPFLSTFLVMDYYYWGFLTNLGDFFLRNLRCEKGATISTFLWVHLNQLWKIACTKMRASDVGLLTRLFFLKQILQQEHQALYKEGSAHLGPTLWKQTDWEVEMSPQNSSHIEAKCQEHKWTCCWNVELKNTFKKKRIKKNEPKPYSPFSRNVKEPWVHIGNYMQRCGRWP